MRTLAVGRAGKGFFLAAILQSVVLIDTLCGGGLCVCVCELYVRVSCILFLYQSHPVCSAQLSFRELKQ